MIGKVLGRYQLVSQFGEGGMGVVYRARGCRGIAIIPAISGG